jgi:hypothetical protein
MVLGYFSDFFSSFSFISKVSFFDKSSSLLLLSTSFSSSSSSKLTALFIL